MNQKKKRWDELVRRMTSIKDEMLALADKAENPGLSAADERHWESLRAEFDELDGEQKTIAREMDVAKVRQLASDPRNVVAGSDPGTDYSEHRRYEGDPSMPQYVREARDAGLRTIERHEGVLSREAADNLDNVVRQRDPQGTTARYLAAVGNPHYMSAFGKIVTDPSQGHLRFSPEEVEAVRQASAEERALNVTTGSAGGFAIPFTLDPSIILSSNGVLNPVRQYARVESISTLEWKGVTSDGVTAAYAAEATEASDNSPTLVQPTVRAEKAQAFVPFSIELGDDRGSLQAELGREFADARDVLDATKFLTGSGTNEPKGLLTGLKTSQRALTNTIAVTAVGDAYLLKQALPARFTSNGTFAMHPNVADVFYRFVGGGSSEPPVMPDRDGSFAGRPMFEWSTMQTGVTTAGQKTAVYGDMKQFLICDRIGGSVELIPHLFEATNRFPTGQCGLYYWWRTGSNVLVPNAFRYLETRTS
jgi:HK97 family phage major capsid protein